MSLNGLDSQKVVDAHQAALAEPGGWFLLHYTSRDELAVRSQGSGGYSELCGVLVTIEEKSPLYGFFLYRRRKVLLKYVPEGTSRILQARVAVHFQAVIDHYPHDAAFTAASPDEINDTALSSKLSLHAEGPLATSDNSLRQRNLSGISENSEPQSSNPEVETILRRLRANKLSQDRATLDSTDQNATPGTDKAEDPTASYEFLPTLDPSQAAYFMAQVSNASETPRVTPKASTNFKDAPPKSDSPLPPLPIDSRQLGDVRNVSQASNERSSPAFDKDTELTYPSTDPTSIDEHRPYTSDSKYSFAAWKPKIKLFPRPATNDSLRDPAKDNSARQKLPSSIRIALQRSQGGDKYAKSEKSVKSSRPKQSKKKSKDLEEFSRNGSPFSQHNGSLTKNDLPPPPKTAPASKPITRKEVPRTQSPAMASFSSDQVPVSPISDIHFLETRDAAGSPNSLAQKSSVSSLTKASMVAPEKARLMKALQQRNQQLMDRAVTAAAATAETDRQLKANGVNLSNHAAPGLEVDPKRAADSGVVLEGTNGGRSTPISPLAANQITKSRDFGMTEKQDENSTAVRTPDPSAKSKAQQTSSSANGLTDHQVKAAKRRSRDPNRKRKTVINTNQASGTAEDSDDGFASDDSFMEELQNAKLEEAQQVTIPHSPVSPVESNTLTKLHSSGERKPTITTVKSVVYQSTSPQSKSTSNRQQDQSPEKSRSPPAARKDSQEKPFASKRINASSGISRRIQTLAEQSNRGNEGQPNYMQTAPLRPGLASIPSSGLPTRPSSSQTSPIIPTSQFSSTANANKQPMSITARIVRPTDNEADDHGATRGIKSIDLQQSEVTVQHQQDGIEHVRSPSKVSFRRVDRPPSVSSRPESRGSVLSNGTKRSIDMGLNFIGLRNDQRSPSRAETATSNKSLETVDELGNEKSKSKTSRLMKRMSGMANASRKVAGAASSVMSGGGGDRAGRMRQGSLSGCIVGDLNVQFPDTLLWKRRWVEIDPSGFLVLSATTSQERQRSAPRRYHMTELKTPVIPSKDGQELPYSVLFDLVAGGTLQLACEDGIGQGQVLKRLSDSHTAWIRNG